MGELAPASSDKVAPCDYPEQKFRYLGLGDIKSGGWGQPTLQLVAGDDVRSSCIQFDDRHVLYAKLRPYLNKVAVPQEEGVGSTEFVPLVPDRSIITRQFLAWYLRSPQFVEYAVRNSTGSRMPRVRMSALWQAEIPLPFLEEQRRIVACIEELFARIAEARRRRTDADKDTEALLSAASSDAFGGLDGKENTKFKKLIVDSRNGLYKPQSFYGSGIPIVRIDSFEAGNIRDYGELKRLQLTQEELEKFSLQSGDVLVNRVNGSLDELGKAAVVRGLVEPTVFESNIMRFRVDRQRVLPEFVVAFLGSPQGHRQIRAKARTIQQFSINQGDVGSLILPVPSLAEQRCIVEHLDSVQIQVGNLKRAQEATTAELERLEQSILARAFRGEL